MYFHRAFNSASLTFILSHVLMFSPVINDCILWSLRRMHLVIMDSGVKDSWGFNFLPFCLY